METHQIHYKGIVINVTGTHYKMSFGNWEEPPEPQEFEIDNISANGLDLTEILDENINEIENLILEKNYS